jgi:hypothetical protein
MKRFATTNTIAARPESVWALLTDAAGFPSWNSTVAGVEGRIAPGGKVTVRTKADPNRAFPLRVSEFVPPSKMVWSGGIPLGLFTGRRTYTLTPVTGGTHFEMVEEFSGLFAPLITKSIPDLQPAFDTFAADLKRRAERIAGNQP